MTAAPPIVRRLWRYFVCGVFGVLAIVAEAAEPASKSQEPPALGELKVGVAELAPFVMRGTNGQWEGLSVELWREVAARRHWSYKLHEYPFRDLFSAVSSGKVDVALTPFPLTPETEEQVDFSHAYYSSGLSVAVARRNVSAFRALARDIFSWQFLGWVIGMTVALLATGAIVWYVERETNYSQFGKQPAVGIGNGIWWAAVTLTTVGYGDKVPRSPLGRILGLLWIFAGVFLLAAFTGHISAILTLDRLGSPIQSPQDLYNYRIGAVARSAADEYLIEHRIRTKTYPTIQAGLAAVRSGDVIAMVVAEPFLRYRLRQDQSSQLEVLPFSLDRRDYAFVLPEGSPLREQVNREILQTHTRAVWKDLLYKYLEE